MLDRRVGALSARSPGTAQGRAPGRPRWRALAVAAALVLAVHALFLEGAVRASVGGRAGREPPVSVRTLLAPRAPDSPVESPRPLASPVVEPMVAGAPPARSDSVRATTAAPAPRARPAPVRASSARPTSSPVEASANTAAAAQATPQPAEAAPLTGTEPPPPLYRPRLPPPIVLVYQVRRGAVTGSGEIRWEPAGDSYRLVLEARVDGLTLLQQTSEGAIDANGLAPTRFLDRRALRSAQAANFLRHTATVTFSGSSAQVPLVAGSQDRLSWMLQLAGVAAAEPERLAEGGRIAMVVVGARGDASVWTFRFAAREAIETARGSVDAVRLVRDALSAHDTGVEVWLDPARGYVAVRAALRNGSGAPEYELLLDRVEPSR